MPARVRPPPWCGSSWTSSSTVFFEAADSGPASATACHSRHTCHSRHVRHGAIAMRTLVPMCDQVRKGLGCGTLIAACPPEQGSSASIYAVVPAVLIKVGPCGKVAAEQQHLLLPPVPSTSSDLSGQTAYGPHHGPSWAPPPTVPGIQTPLNERRKMRCQGQGDPPPKPSPSGP